jgi:hypothetical protein
MRTLSRRTKIILVVGGVNLALAVVAATVLALPGARGLLGSGLRTITPENPIILIGQTQDLVVDSLYKCNWTSSNPALVSFVTNPTDTKAVTVQGNANGTATIRAQCAGFTHGTTDVGVLLPMAPHQFAIELHEYITLTTGDPTTRWTLSDCTWHRYWIAQMHDYLGDGSWVGPWVGIEGTVPGWCTVTATINGLSDSIRFQVWCDQYDGPR